MSKEQSIRVTIETPHAVLKDLTPEQAKELRDILLGLFPVAPVVVREREIVPAPYPYPVWSPPTWYVSPWGWSVSTDRVEIGDFGGGATTSIQSITCTLNSN